MPETMFAGYPAPFVYATPGKTKVQQLIWGDFVKMLGGRDGDWAEVRARGETGWMRLSDLQTERLLEIGFVDIGQGDGSFLVTPNDEFLLVDAGQFDNMKRFLSWRFNLRRNPEREIAIKHAVISHPDQDHYLGFRSLFSSPQFKFDTIFHNGIVERAGLEGRLGKRGDVDGVNCLMDNIWAADEMAARLETDGFVGSLQYPRMLAAALQSGRVGKIEGINVATRFLPDFEDDKELSIEVLAPVPDGEDNTALRWFGDDGKTKNGHSVVLRLRYRDVRILLGGDLNIPAELHLLQHHVGRKVPPAADVEAVNMFVDDARAIFEVDISKACHHGSADFTSVFLRALNPLATVVSSGDDEPHAHPRPDALGSFGKYGRGDRPLIFSTELARSSTENMKDPEAFKAEVQALIARRALVEDEGKRATLDTKIAKKLDELERSVAVYGMINLRTDGKRVLIAQKLERPRSSTHEEWDVHRLEPDDGRQLRYVAKHVD